MAFGENLRLIRKERKMTQEELSEKLCVSRQAVSKWESNEGYPETEKLIRISKELNVSLDYLFNEQSNEIKYEEHKSAVYVPNGKISISSFDKQKIVMCQAVKSSKMLFNGKGPRYILSGVDGISFWGEHSVTLGWYLSEEDIQKEITEINAAIRKGDPSYELKYFVNIEYKGLFGQPHIIE